MALSLEVTSLDGLDEAVKGLYKQDGDKFVLDVSGLPDVTGLKAKNDELLAEKKAASQKAKEAEEAAEQARREKAESEAKKNGDFEAYKKSLDEKHQKEIENLTKEKDSYRDNVVSLTSGQEAVKIASEIAVQGSADVLLPHLKGRLKTDFVDGIPKTIVLDKDGKPSAASIDDLKEEFKSNPAFGPMIVGSNASGAGRSGADGKGGADPIKGKIDGTPKERAAYFAAKHPELNQAK